MTLKESMNPILKHSNNTSEDSCLKGTVYQVLSGAVSAGILCAIVCAVIGLSYIGLGEAQIPVTMYTHATPVATLTDAYSITNTDCANVSVLLKKNIIV